MARCCVRNLIIMKRKLRTFRIIVRLNNYLHELADNMYRARISRQRWWGKRPTHGAEAKVRRSELSLPRVYLPTIFASNVMMRHAKRPEQSAPEITTSRPINRVASSRERKRLFFAFYTLITRSPRFLLFSRTKKHGRAAVANKSFNRLVSPLPKTRNYLLRRLRILLHA